MPSSATRRGEPSELGRLKGDVRMAEAIDRAMRFFQDLPDDVVVAELPDRDVVVRPGHWREALQTCAETQHVPLRLELLDALGELLSAPGVSGNQQVRQALWTTWPDLSATRLVGDLLSHRALLRHCTPWLSAREQEAILADARDNEGWHVTDLPLLDYAHHRLGRPPAPVESAAELRLPDVQAMFETQGQA